MFIIHITVSGNCTETFGIHRRPVVGTGSDHRLPCGTSQWTALYSSSELLLFKSTNSVKSFSPHECARVHHHQFGLKIFLTPNSVAELFTFWPVTCFWVLANLTVSPHPPPQPCSFVYVCAYKSHQDSTIPLLPRPNSLDIMLPSACLPATPHTQPIAHTHTLNPSPRHQSVSLSIMGSLCWREEGGKEQKGEEREGQMWA